MSEVVTPSAPASRWRARAKRGAELGRILIERVLQWARSNPPGTRVHETTTVAGPAAVEIEQRIVAAMTAEGCGSARVGPTTYRFARTVRPAALSASTTLGAVLTLGVLLPLLLLRRTEECTITIGEHPTGAKVTVVGRVPRSALGVIRTGLANSPLHAVAAAAAPAVADATQPRAATVADTTAPRLASPATSRTVLVLDTGERLALSGRIVVGRAPELPAEVHGVQVVRIVDPTRTVSKTHFRVSATAELAWIEDLQSTNGTTLEAPGVPRHRLEPGERAPLVPGAIVEFGDRVARVEEV